MNISKKLLLMTLFFLASSAFAQPRPTILKLQDQAFFTQQGAWIYVPLGKDPVVIHTPGKEQRRVNSPIDGMNFGYRSVRNGFIWDIRRVVRILGDKKEDHSYLYRHPEGPSEAAWERVGQIDTQSGIPHYLVPLDRDGLFLGIGIYTGFFKDGRASHVALFRQRDEKIVFEDLVDMPFGDKSHIGELESLNWPQQGQGPNEEPRKFRKTVVRPSSLTPDLWLPALLPDHLVLGASKAGVLWFFSLKDGQCRRSVNLGQVDPKDLDKLGHLDHFLLAAQPDKDHRLLVVTRESDSLFFAKSLFTPPGVPKEVQQGNRKRFLEIMEGFTKLQWWAIDPETGSKERIEDPSAFPERAFTFRQQGGLRFLVGPEGRVHANTHGSWKDLYDQMGLIPRAPIQEEADNAPKVKKEPVKANQGLAPGATPQGQPVKKLKSDVAIQATPPVPAAKSARPRDFN